MTVSTRRAAIGALPAAPLASVPAVASAVPSDLARACQWASGHWLGMDARCPAENWTTTSWTQRPPCMTPCSTGPWQSSRGIFRTSKRRLAFVSRTSRPPCSRGRTQRTMLSQHPMGGW